MKCDSRASFLARNFTSPCLGHERKARVTTSEIIFLWSLLFFMMVFISFCDDNCFSFLFVMVIVVNDVLHFSL